MLQLKYVVIDGTPVLFGNGMEHKKFSALGEVESAGFVAVSGNGMGKLVAHTYGESFSLRMGPADRDKTIIEMYLNAVSLNEKRSTVEA